MNSNDLSVSDCSVLIEALKSQVQRYDTESGDLVYIMYAATFCDKANEIIKKLESKMQVTVYLNKQTGTCWWLWSNSFDHGEYEWQKGLSDLEETKKWLILKLCNPHIIFEVIG